MPDQSESQYIRRIFIAIGIVTVTVLILLLIRYAFKVFMLLFAASLLAILWRGSAEFIAGKFKWKTGIVLLLVILIHIGVSVMLIVLLAPSLTGQVDVLSRKIPETVTQIHQDLQNSALGRIVSKNITEQRSALGNPQELMKNVVSFFTVTLGVVIDMVVILALALFLAASPNLYKQGFLKLFPPSRRKRVDDVLHGIYRTLFMWFIGKIVDMTSIFIMVAIALWILGVPAVLALALIAFIFSFVPNIGPVISAIPAVLIGFTQSPQIALYVALSYTGIQLFESYFITPNVQKIAIKMPPVLLLLIQLLLAIFGGVLGLFISTPFLAALIVLVRKTYVEDVLGDKPELAATKS